MKLSFRDRLRGKIELPENQAKSWDSSEPVPPAVIERIRFGGAGHHEEVYRQQPAVRTVVDLLARNIGQLNPKVYDRVGDDDRREANDHPLAQLLRKPNPKTTRYRHFRDTVADAAIHDFAVWRKLRSGGQIRQIVRIPPSRLHRQFDERSGRVVYRHTLTQEVIPESDLVIFQGYSPLGNSLGVSAMETLRRVLAEEWAAVRHREGMWRNAARQGAVIRRPAEAPEWGAPERDRFRTDWEAMMTGAANSGRTAILEDGMQLDGFQSFSPKETEYIAGRRLTYEEVAIEFGGAALAALVTGRDGQVGGEEAKAFQRQLYQDVLGPWLRMIQDEIELGFNSMLFDSEYVEFGLGEKLKGSFEEQASVLATSIGVPFMSINDGRSRLNIPKVDTGDRELDRMFDIPVMPLNVIYGGQQSTQEPTEDPSTPPGLLSRGWKQAPRGALRRREAAADQLERLFRKHFRRQERSIVPALTAKQDGDWWDADKWNRELIEDLEPVSKSIAAESGLLAAVQIDGVYDEARTNALLSERARIAAEKINETTRLELVDALDSDEVADAVDGVFAKAKTSRAAQTGLTTATGLIALSREEAGRHTADAQGRTITKEWVVTSAKSRHPEMGGETVAVGETFSNGALWPGDPNLGTDQTAGCSCLLQIDDSGNSG